MDLGHWEYPGDIDITKWVGFIYRIVDTDTGQQYLGKKQFWSITRKKVKGRKNKKIVRTESDWKSYTSSSDHINNAINIKGKEKFLFLIESLHQSKSALHYAEVESQINEDVLRAKLPNGERKFYNRMIANMKFILHDETQDEINAKIKVSLKEFWQNTENSDFNKMTSYEKSTWREKYFLDDNILSKRDILIEEYNLWKKEDIIVEIKK
jgi:hypothetical protein